MKSISLIILLAASLSKTIGLTAVNETVLAQLRLTTDALTEIQYSNATARRARHIHETVELPAHNKKTKRQIIKIPPNVSKVKLVQPPLNLKHSKAPQQFIRYSPIFHSGGPSSASIKNAQMKYNAFHYDPKKPKINYKKAIIKEKFPEEFYRDEEYDFEHENGKHKQIKLKNHRSDQRGIKMKRKKQNQNILGEYLSNYEDNHKEGGGFESLIIGHAGTEGNQPLYGYDSAGSSIHRKQVPPPNSFLPTPLKQSYPAAKTLEQFFHENYVSDLKIKKLPMKGRQIQSLFPQQYTTHNPYVTTNFGLSEAGQPDVLQYGAKGSFVDSAVFEFPHLGKYSQPVVASSEKVVTALPAQVPGIQVIQPPQFRDVTVSHPSQPSRLISSLSQQQDEMSSQKATIRDILEQDCPSFDTKGYCDSPPRYPMHQIKNMAKKCAKFMEVMNTQPFEEPQDVYGLAKKFENHEEYDNKSDSKDTGAQSQSSYWSKSKNDGLTACTSDLELTEPGYAKEVSSGRWFVIVQHPDTTIQRIATDTCRNPGKSCGGLSELKCSKINSWPSKSTTCVQRHTYQRLISWDPDSPDDCPRMRVFRFPSACVCHLSVI